MKDQDIELVPGLARGLYAFDRKHALLAADAWKDGGPNIGVDGRNLTISFLSMNRTTLSARLLRSIDEMLPGFAGEVLIIDNGSGDEELRELRETAASCRARNRIVELGRNYGVAGGRNRTIPHVTTDWLMCLDNDIYFIKDPLPRIQSDLATLGCHFMSLPLLDPDRKTLFARGGHLYVTHEQGELAIGAGSACPQTQVEGDSSPGFLCTFLFGGACVFLRESFRKMGGYDENMFVGFEDIDFSIRLFQGGCKIGATACCALVHDHPKPDSVTDQQYESRRFSRDILKSSADYLEQKHGFRIWNNAVDQWLESRRNELGLRNDGTAGAGRNIRDSSSGKTKICLVTDTEQWAFGNIARQLETHLADRFEFTTIPMDVLENISQIFLMAQDCELIHFFWREHLRLIGSPYGRSYPEKFGWKYENFDERFVRPRLLSTSVYDHLLLGEEEIRDRKDLFSNVIAGYTVGSEKLYAIYSGIEGYPKPDAVVEDGVDLQLFHPINIERLRNTADRELVLGWVGNSKWAADLEDFKGVHTILKPAVERLKEDGWPVRLLLADRQEGLVPHRKMPEYYSRIDVLICASKIEGTPNPVLEAMACGVPIISTDVGIVQQVLGDHQKTYILEERTIEMLAAKIKELMLDRNILPALSEENLISIRKWDWAHQARKFGDYFERILADNGRLVAHRSQDGVGAQAPDG